jgi:MFS family permease
VGTALDAPSPARDSEGSLLIIFRGIQGLGAGALFPMSFAVMGDLYSPAERGKYQGLFGAVFGLSSIVGPLLGGFLTEQVSWHWIFLVNLPIGLIALFVIFRLCRPSSVLVRATTSTSSARACSSLRWRRSSSA